MPINELVITGIGFPPASIRGVTQSLNQISMGAQLARTVNGAMIDLSPPQFKKYHSSISCTDHQVPALDGVWVGKVVTVDCVAELSYLTVGGSPERPVISSYIDGAYTFYRPRLEMMITGFSIDRDEWGAITNWSIELEEI